MLRILAGLLLLASSLAAQTTLQFRPLAAGYSRQLDRIIMTAESPNSLHIYDPATDADVVVALAGSPLSLSVLPNGLSAAVGMNGQIVVVNLATAAVSATHPVTGIVSSLVATDSFVHFEVSNTVKSLSLSTGAVAAVANTIYASLVNAKLHSSGNWIYYPYSGYLGRIDISTGPATAVEQNYNSSGGNICGDLWRLEGGTQIVSGCGGVYSTTAAAATDRKYVTTLAGIYTIRDLVESTALGRVAALALGNNSYSNLPDFPRDNEILFYNGSTLEETGRVRLNDFVVNSVSHQAHGKWIFFDNSGNTLYAVMQADAQSGLLRDYAIQTFSLGNPAPCVPVLNPASAITVPWNGATGEVEVTAPGCLFGTASNGAWLQVIAGLQNGGSRKIRYHASANATSSARTATLTIGGVALTVTQDAAPSPLPASWRLSYPVVDAEKSESLDKSVLVSAGPNELHLFDTVTGADQTVALPRTPLSVGVRPDGLMAAVGYDGSVGLVDLQTMQPGQRWVVPIPVRDVVFAGNGYVYLFPRSGSWRVHSLDTATGTITEFQGGNDYAVRLQPGSPYIYSGYYYSGKYTTTNGPLESAPTPAGGYACGEMWFSQDGGRAFSSCGSVLRTSAIPAQDLASNGSFFPGGRTITWVDHAAAKNSTIVLANSSNWPYPGAIHFFGDETLGLSSIRNLPAFRKNTTDYVTRGAFGFWGASGANAVVFARVESNAQLKDDMFVHRIIPNIGVGGCTATLSGTSAAVAAGGEGGTLGVVSGDTCNWTSSSSATWLRITAGTFGMSNGNVLFVADRNPYALSRTATITAAGQTFTVTQAGGTASAAPTLLTTTPVNPAAAAAALQFTARDLDGTANLARLYFHIGANTIDLANGCHGFYDRPTNSFWLYTDSLATAQGPLSPGGAGTVENSRCKLHAATSASAVASATDLNVTFGLEMKGPYLTGDWNHYLWITDAQGRGTGWKNTGVWSVAPSLSVAPTVVTTGVTALTGLTQTFTLRGRDSNGAADIYRIYFVANSGPSVPANSCHGFYNRATNALYLFNDALTALAGPLTPGVNAKIQNSQCEIDGATTTVSQPNGTDIVVNLKLRGLGSFATGSRNFYAWVRDNQTNDTGWVQTATWASAAANQAPAVVSGTPATSTALTESFTFTVRDTDGVANLARIYFLVNPTLTIPANTCHGFYDRAMNAYFLYSDGLTTVAGPIVAGAAGVMQNGQCSLDVGASPVVSAVGSDLVFTLRLTAKGSSLAATQKVAVWATDLQGNGTGWVETSAWTAGTGGGPVAPSVVSVTPATVTNTTSQTFTAVIRDANGATNLSRVYFALHSSAAAVPNSCHGFYDRQANAVFVYNDALNAVQGPLIPGAAAVAENSRCRVSGTGMTAVVSGNDLTLALPMTKLGTYASAAVNLYLWAVDQDGLGTGWQQGATWGTGVANVAPTIINLSPSVAAGIAQTFSMTARDGNGAGDISRIYFVLNSTASVPANSCHGFYDRATNRVYLFNDSVSALMTGFVTPGASGTIQNSQCSIDGAFSSVTANASDVTLGLRFNKLGSFIGTSKNVYWWAVDNSANGTGWITGGSWAP